MGLQNSYSGGSYWRPEFIYQFGDYKLGIESFLICFLYGGAFGALYELITRRTPVRSQKYSHGKVIFFRAVGVGIVVLLFAYKVLDWNLVYASGLSMFIISLVFIYFRRDLMLSILLSGIFALAIALTTYWILGQIYPEMPQWYISEGLTGLKLFNFPVEEILWHVPLAMALSAMYEVIYNKIDRRIAHKN